MREKQNRMNEIRKHGAFKERSWQSTQVRRDHTTHPIHSDTTDLRDKYI